MDSLLMQTLSESKAQSWLTWFFKGLLVLSAIVLMGRLAELQIIKGAYFRDLSNSNRLRRVIIRAPRGKILARGGEVIVGNREVRYAVVFDPESGYEKRLVDDKTPEDEIITEWIRIYELGDDFAHVSGYLGEVDKDEVGKVDPNCIQKGARKLGSLAGRTGLESYYDCTLRGIAGEELVEIDTFGKRMRTFGRKLPVRGEDVRTTIDFDLQKKVAEIVQAKKGIKKEDLPAHETLHAVVVVTDSRGEILALYSSPSFDPNLFVSKDNLNDVGAILDDSNMPLFNRAIGGAYHPGSIFKIVTAVAALEEGKINKDYKFEDTGVIRVGEFEYFNWYFTQYGRTEGLVGLVRALSRSTDTFFYKAGELVGIEKLEQWAKLYGLGEELEIDLPGEVAGLVPSPAWKKAVKGERWFLGNTYHLSIGQGDITMTPLQGNVMTSVIASGGKLCRPYVVSNQWSRINDYCKDLNINKETIKLVKEGMIGACSSGGTGYPFFDFEPRVACKTGTAETYKEEITHAWFTVFAPSDFPEIVVTVLVEEGGEGSRVAAPLAREIMDYWFNK